MDLDSDSTSYSNDEFEVSDGDDGLETGSVDETSRMDVGDRKRGHEGETSSVSVDFGISEGEFSSDEMSASPDVHSDGVSSVKLSSCAGDVACEEDEHTAKKVGLDSREKDKLMRSIASSNLPGQDKRKTNRTLFGDVDYSMMHACLSVSVLPVFFLARCMLRYI